MWRNMKNKIAKKNITIAIIILLVGLIIGLLIYNINKTKVFKATVNTLSNNLIEGLDNKNIDFLNIDGPTRFNFTFNEEDDLNDKISLKLEADNKNNKLGLDINYNSLYDINLYHDNNIYLKSNTLLDNIYQLNLDLNSNCEVNCDASLNDYIKTLTSSLTFNTSNLKDLVNMLNSTINKSFKGRYVSTSKESVTINDNKVKLKRYTYKLNKDSIKVLINNIDKNTILKDKLFSLFENYFKRYNITADNFKEIYNNINEKGTFSVYEQNGTIKIVDIDWGEFLDLSVRPDGDKVNINVGGDFIALEFKLSIDKTNQEYLINVYNLGKLIYDINISKKDILLLDIKLYHEDKTYPIIITNKANKDGDITKGLLTLKYKDTTYDINYEIEKNITMNDYNFDNALSIKSIDEIDMTKINEAIEVISNSNLIKNLSNIVQELTY